MQTASKNYYDRQFLKHEVIPLMKVSEVVVIEDVLPQPERARVERALVSRWQCNPVPPADGGHVRLRADAVVDESSRLHVELERMGGSDGYVALSYSFVDGSALYGVEGGFSVMNGTNGSGFVSWGHGELGTRVLIVEPIQDHWWSGNRTFSVHVDIVYAEFMPIHLPVRQRSFVILNNDPHILELEPRNAPTVGGVTVTLTGLGFKLNNTRSPTMQEDGSIYMQPTPLTYDMRIGNTSCKMLSWVSETALECVLAAGAGGALAVRVSVDGNWTQNSSVFSYDVPSVAQFLPRSSATTGGAAITVLGVGFGTSDYSPTVSIGYTDCVTTAWTSDSSATCVLAAGVGVRLDVNASLFKGTAHVVVGTAAERWSYQRPVISNVSRLQQTGRLPTIAIVGRGFGDADYGPIVRVGGAACTETVWASDRSLACLVPPGSGEDNLITVDVAGGVAAL